MNQYLRSNPSGKTESPAYMFPVNSFSFWLLTIYLFVLLFSDNIRDFTDCLIAAEREARTEEAPADLAQLTNTHFVQTLSDIFAGKSKYFPLKLL